MRYVVATDDDSHKARTQRPNTDLVGYGPDPIGKTWFDIGFFYIYIICRCLGLCIMYLKAAINKIVSLSVWT